METPEELPVVDATVERDHPDDLTDAEAEDGLVTYMEVDDLDDDSNGLDT